jgi:N-acetylmuramoyl-L-alanine amidase
MGVRVVGVAAMLALVGPALAAVPALDRIEVTGDEVPAVRLHVTAPVLATAHRLPAEAGAPARIYVSLSDAALGAALPHVIAGAGPVVRIRAAQFNATTVRVVLELERRVPFVLRQTDETITLDLQEPPPAAVAPEAPASAPTAAPEPPTPELTATVPDPPAPAPAAGVPEPSAPGPAAGATEAPAPAPSAGAPDLPAPAPTPAVSEPSAAPTATAAATPEPPPPVPPPLAQPSTPRMRPRTVARPLVSHPPLIVLDAGHGGRDPGAAGIGGVREKDIVLEVSQMVAGRLAARLPVEVLLTRTDDSFVPIERRIAMPGDGATLFISLHANACSDPNAQGLEVFYGGGAVQAASTPGGSWRAALLGRCLDHALQRRVGGVRGEARPGPFGVLVRNPAPSALVEIGYLTHPGEAARAQDRRYHELLADAVVDGVAAFLRASAPPL